MTHHNQAFCRPNGVHVHYRRVQFPFEQKGFARYWHSNSPFKSLFWSQLSTSFEAGEKFFIDSARGLKQHISDPGLLDEYQEFCKQEGHHTHQHLKLDRMNAEQGVDIETCRKRYARVLQRCRDRLTPMQMLSVTVALEHFTAGLSEQHFRRPALMRGADPNVLALWDWHAAEETEHKATCFDIYRAAGGGYWQRVSIMPIAWGIILVLSLMNTFTLLRKDGKLWSRDTRKGLGYLFGRRGLVTGLVPTFFEYFSPRWHPWQQDNSQDIARWEQENQSYVQPTKPRPLAAAS
jgi:uncharacterized protein